MNKDKEHAMFVNSRNNNEGIERVMKLLSVVDDDEMNVIHRDAQREFWVGDDLKDFEQYEQQQQQQQQQQKQQHIQKQKEQQEGGNATATRASSAASTEAASETPASPNSALKRSLKNPFRSSMKMTNNNINDSSSNHHSKISSISEEVASLGSASSSLAAYSTASWKKIGGFAGLSSLARGGKHNNNNNNNNSNKNHSEDHDKKRRSRSLIPRRPTQKQQQQQQQLQQRRVTSSLDSQTGTISFKNNIRDKVDATLDNENHQDKNSKKIRGSSLPPLKHDKQHPKEISTPSKNSQGNVTVRPVPFQQQSTKFVAGSLQEHPPPSFQHNDTQDTAVCNSIGSNGTTASSTRDDGGGNDSTHGDNVNEHEKGVVVLGARGEARDRGRSRSCSSSNRHDYEAHPTVESVAGAPTSPMEEAKKSRRSFSLTPMKSKVGLLLLSSKQHSSKRMMKTATKNVSMSTGTSSFTSTSTAVKNRAKSLPRLTKKSSSNSNFSNSSNATPPKLFREDENIHTKSHYPYAYDVDKSTKLSKRQQQQKRQLKNAINNTTDDEYDDNNINTKTNNSTTISNTTTEKTPTTTTTTSRTTPKPPKSHNTKKSKPKIHCVICKRRLHSNQYVEFCNLHFCDASHGRDGTSCFKCATCHCSLDDIVSALTDHNNNNNGISANDAFLRWTKVISNSRGSVVQCGRCAMGAAFPSTSYYCPDGGTNANNRNDIINNVREESAAAVAGGSGPGPSFGAAAAAAAAMPHKGEEEKDTRHHHHLHQHQHVHHQDIHNQEYTRKKSCDPPSISDEEDFDDSTAAVAAAKLSTNYTIMLDNVNDHRNQASSTMNKGATPSAPFSPSSVSSVPNNAHIGNNVVTLQQQQQQQYQLQQQQQIQKLLHNQTQKYHHENAQLKLQNHRLTNTVAELSSINSQSQVREADLLQRIADLERETMELKEEKRELKMDLEEVVLENDSLKFVLEKVRERLELDDRGVGGGYGDGDGDYDDDGERYDRGGSRNGYGDEIYDRNSNCWVRPTAIMGRGDKDHHYDKRNCSNGSNDL
ncbi:hypothetical protein ACHAXS_009579 [Conticribra weissflogii]